MTSRSEPSRGARAVIAILAAIALAGEASATSFKHVPVRDAVTEADAIVRGQVVAVEPIDGRHDVVVVKVPAVLEGDVPKDATIRVVGEEIGFNVRGLVIRQLVEAAAEGGGDVSRRGMTVLDGVLAREPEKTESAWIVARAYEAASTIARKQFGFTEEITTIVDYQAFYPPEQTYHGNPEALRAAAKPATETKPANELAMARRMLSLRRSFSLLSSSNLRCTTCSGPATSAGRFSSVIRSASSSR